MLTHSFMFWIEKLFECKKYLICNFMKDKEIVQSKILKDL